MTSQFSQPIDAARRTVPSAWALVYTDAAAQYAQELWAEELKLPGARKATWDKSILDEESRSELKHLVLAFVRALHNQYILDWTCDSYNAFVRGQDGKNPKFEKALSTRYPPKNIIESGPASVADSAGVIALYFVPDALTSNRQAQIFMSVSGLNPTLERGLKDLKKTATWRKNIDNFRPDAPGLLAFPGLVTIGIRQSTGHETPLEDIHIAADLGSSGNLSEAQRSARDWLSNSLVFGALMSAALAITHPEQYALTRECLIRLAEEHPDLETVLRIWPFAFNALAVVSNRCTPMHRDRKSGDDRDYDGMVTVGGDDDVTIKFDGLGFWGRYRSGTMVWTSCHTQLHSVSDSPIAERIAFAAFVKQSVQLDTELDRPRAPTLELVNSIHMQQIKSRRQ